ncbi:Kidins220 [Symbiodinium sp. CCMP2592]|nr:Kidins220 [Symbiodinium sp. CCMP2592]
MAEDFRRLQDFGVAGSHSTTTIVATTYKCVGEWLHQHAKCPLRCPGLVLPPLQERSDSRDSWVQEMGGDVFRADGFGSLDPWLIGAPLYDTPVQLFRERLDPMPLPSAVLEEESDSEEETPGRDDST